MPLSNLFINMPCILFLNIPHNVIPISHQLSPVWSRRCNTRCFLPQITVVQSVHEYSMYDDNFYHISLLFNLFMNMPHMMIPSNHISPFSNLFMNMPCKKIPTTLSLSHLFMICHTRRTAVPHITLVQYVHEYATQVNYYHTVSYPICSQICHISKTFVQSVHICVTQKVSNLMFSNKDSNLLLSQSNQIHE